MPKFFVAKENIGESTIHIEGEDVVHISRVLRMRTGEMLTVCDGEGTDYECSISEISKKEVICDILTIYQNPCEHDVKITLYQSLPKGAKTDFVVQKCVETGITAIVPFISARTVAKGDKCERLRKISQEAAKQSGRGIVPVVYDTVDFKDAISMLAENELAIIAYEEEHKVTLQSVLRGKSPKSIGIMIGPEGGFAPDEVEKAVAVGATSVTLGKRILRTETAGMVVLSNIVYEYNL